MTEWLDIVNEDDIVIGRAPRDQIHSQGHFHRSSHVALFNSNGQIFVQLRSQNKDSGAGLWDISAAGHVDSGESYLDCAVRELNEELGVIVSPDMLTSAGRLRPEERNGFEFTEVYTLCSEQIPVLQKEEIDDGVWLSPDELDAWILRQQEAFTEVFMAVWPMARTASGTIA